jgi:predicted CXXCH cytochrome family protein
MKQTNRIGHRTKLLVASAMFVASLLIATEAVPAAGPHGPYSTVADECAACHRVHAGAGENVVNRVAPQSTLCLTCHDGSGASTDVRSEYTDPTVPANNPATRDFYSHDALVVTNHTLSKMNEFGGVSNRHSECSDCHNAHSAGGANGTETPTGWTTSARLSGVSGVAVVNGPANTVPSYTFRDGDSSQVDREYQLCFKCHSSFTVLPSNSGFPPSRYVLDKAVEFNPNNASYHPVEAPGKNTSAAMAASLAGPSPYKQWNFTTASTIRCTSCHASSSRYSQPTPPTAGAPLPPHTSRYRGILLQNYRDRVLKSSGEAYSAADFALCLMCHGEAPFASETSTATNFPFHGKHVANIAGVGSGGTNIDTPGAGQGNAICAECHFRLHSSSYADGTQTIDGSRLVNFAPDVLPYNGTRSWSDGSCTLLCHGKVHDDLQY